MKTTTRIKAVAFELLEAGIGSNQYEGFDYTKLTAINTCPVWGITRYGMHLRMPTFKENARSMPLEMGQAAHEAFAAIRISQLWAHLPDHARYHAARVFGADRASQLLSVIQNADTIESSLSAVSVEAIATSGFTDSDFDKRRTVSNLEASVLAYAQSYDYQRFPVWTSSVSDPRAPVGIEQPFSVLVTFLMTDDTEYHVRLTGKIDGLHHNGDKPEVMVHENKTGGRLDDSWERSFDTSHQVTGYCVAGTLLSGSPIRRALVRGVQVPLPRMVLSGLRDVWQVREDHQRQRWVEWILHTYLLYQEYKDRPMDAPKYTHSCNRYFRPCSMIPFCVADDAEQTQIISEMVKDEWSPLAEEYDA